MKIEMSPEDKEKKRKQDELTASRTKSFSDAELLREGAQYVSGDTHPRLEVTKTQLFDAILDEEIVAGITRREIRAIPDYNHTIHPAFETLRQSLNVITDPDAKKQISVYLQKLEKAIENLYFTTSTITHKLKKEDDTRKRTNI